MINVLSMIETGVVNDLREFRFEFEFDNASTLPINFVIMEQKRYLIADGSTAKNLSTDTYYRYNSANVCWVKMLAKIPTPVNNEQITENGHYNIVNNSFIGYRDTSVNVSGSGGNVTLIEKSITENGEYLASVDNADGYFKVTVDVSGSASAQSGVTFYDYDGTVVATYSANEFVDLSVMPNNPTPEGLISQGWNWSLADAKAYVASYGKLNIGQMYITSDGKTRLYFTVTKDNLSANLYLNLESDTELDIDWGDGSEHTAWTSDDDDSSKLHDYTSAGRYVIAITVVTGEFSLSQPVSNIYKVEIGNGVTSIRNGTFSNCFTLSSVTIPSSVTSIGNSAFSGCYTLSSITIPDRVTSIGNSAFSGCSSLSSLTIPNGVTSIDEGIVSNCFALSSVTIPDTVTSIGDSAFSNCLALSSITIPDSVAGIDEYAFFYCYILSSITIPSSVTNIGGSAFSGCYALSSITIPSSVTSIDSSVFSNCYSLSSITFESLTPPELYGDLAIPNTCIIRVPQGSLSSYTLAENYPDSSAYIYEEY